MKHRIPPKPIHYSTAPLGYCRYCGGGIYREDGRLKTRANWHPSCLEEYKLIYWPGKTRAAVWKRDHGQCAHCVNKADRNRNGAWHMDHIKPLVEAKGDLSYWRLGNLQTLCEPCHKAKTAAEATARAAARRAKKGK